MIVSNWLLPLTKVELYKYEFIRMNVLRFPVEKIRENAESSGLSLAEHLESIKKDLEEWKQADAFAPSNTSKDGCISSTFCFKW